MLCSLLCLPPLLPLCSALAHPYLKLLHDPSDEPVAHAPFDSDLENMPLNKEALRALLWEEVCQLHPSEGRGGGPSQQDVRSMMEDIKRAQQEAVRKNGGKVRETGHHAHTPASMGAGQCVCGLAALTHASLLWLSLLCCQPVPQPDVMDMS